MIRIVTDSTTDLPDGELGQLGVVVVPIHIHFGEEEYREGETLGHQEFYKMVDARGIVPKTSQPSPGELAQAYRELAGQGATSILSIHITGELSGTVSSAQLAAEMVKDLLPVYVFDTRAGSAATGFMIREACERIDQGAGVEAILARWAEIRDQVRIFFYLDTLRYARMSGRIGAMQSTLASVLNIKPLVKLDEGRLDVVERVRTRKAALVRLLDMVEEEVGRGPLNLAVIHAESPDGASDLLAQAKARFDCRSSLVADLATSIACHLGVGTLGVVAYPAPPQG